MSGLVLRRARLAAGWAAMVLVSGCVNLGGGKPPANFMTLTAEASAPAGATLTNSPGTTILINEPVTPRELGVARVPVTMPDSTIAYLKGAIWVERPSRLFRSLLAETIRAGGKHLVFQDDEAEVHAGARLSGRLDVMGYDAGAHSVVVRFDAVRTAADGTITSRRFEATEPNIAPDQAAVGPALNEAANDVARQVADWVG